MAPPNGINDLDGTVNHRFRRPFVPWTTVAPVSANHRKTAKRAVRSPGGRVQTLEEDIRIKEISLILEGEL